MVAAYRRKFRVLHVGVGKRLLTPIRTWATQRVSTEASAPSAMPKRAPSQSRNPGATEQRGSAC